MRWILHPKDSSTACRSLFEKRSYSNYSLRYRLGSIAYDGQGRAYTVSGRRQDDPEFGFPERMPQGRSGLAQQFLQARYNSLLPVDLKGGPVETLSKFQCRHCLSLKPGENRQKNSVQVVNRLFRWSRRGIHSNAVAIELLFRFIELAGIGSS